MERGPKFVIERKPTEEDRKKSEAAYEQAHMNRTGIELLPDDPINLALEAQEKAAAEKVAVREAYKNRSPEVVAAAKAREVTLESQVARFKAEALKAYDEDQEAA